MKIKYVIFVAAGLFILIAVGPRPRLEPYVPTAKPARPESTFPLRPETEKRIAWASPVKARTPLALVYLHGFSASRREISPVVENIAETTGSNVFFTRLTGHGMTGSELANASTSDWFADAEEALTVGSGIGQSVILIGTSTGATLGVWLAHRHPEIAGLVLISPNFGPKDRRGEILLWPWGLSFIKTIVAKERSWTPANALQMGIWTYRYPVEALIPMMLLCRYVRSLDLSVIRVPLITIYTESDESVSTQWITDYFPTFGSESKRLVRLDEATTHVLAGDAFSPNTTDAVTKLVLRFVQRLGPVKQ